MINKVIQLTEDAKLYVYVSDICMHHMRRDGLLVIPGGGYGFVSMDREGEPIALEFMGRGMSCFVLEYSIGDKAVFPRPLQEAALAMKHIKEHAEEYNVDPDRIFAVGFSAGGHLCGSLGSFWNREEVTSIAGMTPQLAKPRGTLLIYPVISSGKYAHANSFKNLLGSQTPTQEQLERYSLELRVSEETVPAFLAHTATDPIVPVENSLLYAMALSSQNISFESHIFPNGTHGLALSNYITGGLDQRVKEFAQWTDLAWDWMQRM